MMKNSALQVAEVDLYAPRKTGVYNVELKQYEKGNLGQQWTYDSEQKSVRIRKFPNKALFEGANKNLIVYAYKGMKQQQFVFDHVSGKWTNANTQNALQAKGLATSATTAPFHDKLNQKWGIEYCEDAH